MIYRTEKKFTGNFLYMKGENLHEEEIKYEITGLISLVQKCKEGLMEYAFILALIKALSEEGIRLEQSELNLNGWILDPEYIYVYMPGEMVPNVSNDRNYKIHFIYYPGKSGLYYEPALNYLAEFIIENVDYSDRRAVDLSYSFYMQIYHKDYSFTALLKRYS